MLYTVTGLETWAVGAKAEGLLGLCTFSGGPGWLQIAANQTR
jgi:hypothetical protein